MTRLTYISLYSGAGGMDLGMRAAGLEPILMVDIDADCCATLRDNGRQPHWYWYRHPIREMGVSTATIEGVIGPPLECTRKWPDLVVGGPPCQGFSVAGKMDPADPRSRNVFTFMDAVEKARPRAFIMENVAALAKPRWSRVMSELGTRATTLGYSSIALVLDAADYGVAQHRERLFLIGLPPGASRLRLLAATAPRRPLVSAGEVLRGLDRASFTDVSCPARITLAKKPVIRKSPYAGMLVNGAGRVIDLREPAPTLPATMGGNRTPIIDLDQLELEREPWIEAYHRRVAAGFPPLPAVPEGPRMRRLTLREAAALQGFPPDYQFCGSPSSQFRQVGNAVPPPLAEAVARAVVAALEAE